MIDLMLVAPVRAYRDALCAAITADDNLRIVAHAASGAEALAQMPSRTPEVALLDFGIDQVLPILAALRRTTPATQLLAIAVPTTRAQSETVVRAAENGVVGFIDAEQPLTDIVGAIHLAARGQSLCSPRIAATLLYALRRRPGPIRWPYVEGSEHPGNGRAPRRPGLTRRELMVAQLVTRGMTNRQIAGELVVGEATVKTHVHAVLRKLGVDRREQIALSDLLDLHLPGPCVGGRPADSRSQDGQG